MEFLGDLLEWFGDTWSSDTGWLARTWEHLRVSGAALLAAMVFAIPIAAWLGHRRRGGFLVTSLVNIGRALPSFGILALSLPFTIWLARSTPLLDRGLGFAPTFVALFLLALPPIFINTYTGVAGVDSDIVEAARGMGITERRLIIEVEIPIASPVILTGIRVTAVQVVATATLGALVGYGGYGRYIVDGFATQDHVELVAGAVLVAVLSILTEIGFSLLERVVVPNGIRRRTRSEVRMGRAV
ncbi:MAG TPA: ABC transporter permease [Acidimicrobiia bacterium]|nr:ABC transporter permease [Acidimicrobiia bacterium]